MRAALCADPVAGWEDINRTGTFVSCFRSWLTPARGFGWGIETALLSCIANAEFQSTAARKTPGRLGLFQPSVEMFGIFRSQYIARLAYGPSSPTV